MSCPGHDIVAYAYDNNLKETINALKQENKNITQKLNNEIEIFLIIFKNYH